jgi:hypothetical protein
MKTPPTPLKMGRDFTYGHRSSTPMSQASTAPSTPFTHSLPSPLVFPSFHLARQATPEEPGDWQLEDKGTQSSEISTEGADAEESLEEAMVDTDDLLKAPRKVKCVGMPPLVSELGQWAQRLVLAEQWLEEKQAREFVVQAFPDLEAARPWGLAYRRSKRLDDRDNVTQGPAWGTSIWGVDLGDGWLKVPTENRYLPMSLGGVPVVKLASISECHVEASWDGPALTPDGRVLDLDGGVAIFFSHHKDMSFGRSMSHSLKDDVKFNMATKVAHAACEGEMSLESGQACSVDAAGTVRGALPASGASCYSRAVVLKKLHRRQQQKRRMFAEPPGVLCVDASNKVCIQLSLPDDTRRSTRLALNHRRRLAACARPSGCLPVCTDGVLHPED